MATEPPRIAAIDIGSNGVRMTIASLEPRGALRVVESTRAAVRLGADVFTIGAVQPATANRAAKALAAFKTMLDRHGVARCRAVATSALREARNRVGFIERIARATGIRIDLITGEEEAQLVLRAVASSIDLSGRTALLIDIGGGSVEVTLVDRGQPVASDSFRLGAVRLLEQFRNAQLERSLAHLIRDYASASRRRLADEIGGRRIDLAVATGGNCESLAQLCHDLLDGPPNVITAAGLETIIEKLQRLEPEERSARYGLRPDRADVILPAALVLRQFLQHAQVDRARVPPVSLRDGLLELMADELRGRPAHAFRDAALAMGRKFHFDEKHGLTVARLALRLFDLTRDLHRLGPDARDLLEVSAILHDVGHSVNASSHHKHSYYLLMAAPLAGLTQAQRAIVANVARYHRKAAPTLRHEPYRALAPAARSTVRKLAALLRLADAMDIEHADQVTEVRLTRDRSTPSRVTLHLRGHGDMLLERWAVERKAGLFEKEMKVRVEVKG